MLLPNLLCPPFLGWRSFMHLELLCNMQVACLSGIIKIMLTHDAQVPVLTITSHMYAAPSLPLPSEHLRSAIKQSMPKSLTCCACTKLELLPLRVVTVFLQEAVQRSALAIITPTVRPHTLNPLQLAGFCADCQSLEQLLCNAAGLDRESDCHHPRRWLGSNGPASRRWG